MILFMFVDALRDAGRTALRKKSLTLGHLWTEMNEQCFFFLNRGMLTRLTRGRRLIVDCVNAVYMDSTTKYKAWLTATVTKIVLATVTKNLNLF